MKKIKFSNDLTEEIINKYLKGQSLSQLSKIYKVSINVIKNHLIDRGIEIRKYKLTEEQEKKIVELYNTGLNSYVVGEKFNVSKTTILNILKKRNIALRESGRKTIKFDKEEVFEDYFENILTATQIANKYGVHNTTVARYIQRQGLQMRKHTLNQESVHRNYELNESYFESINTPDKAYWLGFFAADGYITSNNLKMGFLLNRGDKKHLEKLQKALESNYPLSVRTFYASILGGDIKQYSNVSLHINSKKLVNDIIYLGFTSNKTKDLKYPKINMALDRHFIRGYLDGDGSIQLEKDNNGDFKVVFVGTYAFLQKIKQIISNNCNVSKKVRVRKMGNIYELKWGGRRQVLRILDWLYTDANEDILLDRKYELYLEIPRVDYKELYINIKNTKYPEIIRNRRSELGLSQKQLGEKVQLSQSYISSIENEYRSSTKKEYLQKLLDILGLVD